MNRSILNKCVLFEGLSEGSLEYALDFFNAQEKQYKKGWQLHHEGDVMRNFGLVLSGQIQVFMDDFDGNRMIMANVTPGTTFAESLCYLKRISPVNIEAVLDSTVLVMNTDRLNSPSASPSQMDLQLAGRFTAMLAGRALSMNDRIQILSKQSIREKVITLLSQHSSRESKGLVRLPFSREAMARYLGVNQSALSRELSNMAKDGIIEFKGSSFHIL
jgi:CRP-like cAMP-binding protein